MSNNTKGTVVASGGFPHAEDSAPHCVSHLRPRKSIRSFPWSATFYPAPYWPLLYALVRIRVSVLPFPSSPTRVPLVRPRISYLSVTGSSTATVSRMVDLQDLDAVVERLLIPLQHARYGIVSAFALLLFEWFAWYVAWYPWASAVAHELFTILIFTALKARLSMCGTSLSPFPQSEELTGVSPLGAAGKVVFG